jgi:hypothetical protein
MKRTTKYVDLDVHQAITVASVRGDTGKVIARSILPAEKEALLEFFRGMRGSVHGDVVDADQLSDDLRLGGLRAVYGSRDRAALKEFARPLPCSSTFHAARRSEGPELARVTLARKLAALSLRIWKTGARYDASKLSVQVT